MFDINPEGKTDEQVAQEGLEAMKAWMKELGLVMNIRNLGANDEMIEGIAKATLILKSGYKVLDHDEVVSILKEALHG